MSCTNLALPQKLLAHNFNTICHTENLCHYWAGYLSLLGNLSSLGSTSFQYRLSNPTRACIIEQVTWTSLQALLFFSVDRYSFHFLLPLLSTHQNLLPPDSVNYWLLAMCTLWEVEYGNLRSKPLQDLTCLPNDVTPAHNFLVTLKLRNKQIDTYDLQLLYYDFLHITSFIATFLRNRCLSQPFWQPRPCQPKKISYTNHEWPFPVSFKTCTQLNRIKQVNRLTKLDILKKL